MTAKRPTPPRLSDGPPPLTIEERFAQMHGHFWGLVLTVALLLASVWMLLERVP